MATATKPQTSGTTVKSADIARELIRDVGGNPNNTAMVRAIEIWLAGESGAQILSNNPWNLRPGTDYNTCNKGADYKNFTVFCSWQDGVKATAQRLSKDDYRGYRPVYNAIQKGDPIAFFTALAKSKWSSDHYGGGSKFIARYRGGANYNHTLSFASRGNGSPSAPPPADHGSLPSQQGDDLAAFNSLVSFPVGHKITLQDIATISSKLHDAGWFEPDPFDAKRIAFEAFLRANALDQPWTKSLQDKLAGQASTDAGNVATATDPLGVSSALSGFADVLTKLGAYAIAVVFIIVGLFIYAKAGQARMSAPDAAG